MVAILIVINPTVYSAVDVHITINCSFTKIHLLLPFCLFLLFERWKQLSDLQRRGHLCLGLFELTRTKPPIKRRTLGLKPAASGEWDATTLTTEPPRPLDNVCANLAFHLWKPTPHLENKYNDFCNFDTFLTYLTLFTNVFPLWNTLMSVLPSETLISLMLQLYCFFMMLSMFTYGFATFAYLLAVLLLLINILLLLDFRCFLNIYIYVYIDR